MKNHKLLSYIILAMFIWLMVVPVQAQAPSIETTLTSPESTYTLGDPITLTLTIVHPPSYTVLVPPLETWGDLRVRSQSTLDQQTNDDETVTSQQTIIASRFELGQFDTAPLSITLRAGDIELIETNVPAYRLEIVSVLTSENPDLVDIRPQASLDRSLLSRIPNVVWPLLAISVVTALVYWWLYREREKEEWIKIEETRPAHEVAWNELDRIERLNLPQQNAFKQYYILLSECMRGYLDGRYDIPALDSTSLEIKTALRKQTLTANQQQVILEMLTECDMGKFAEFTPTVEEADSLLYRAREWVGETREKPKIV
ncbi:hypothetical protein QUF58_09665 [Anaerolineales bacterium HSG24]|nr:hypothetical protein [Anaerolineales bacterium HSG24]